MLIAATVVVYAADPDCSIIVNSPQFATLCNLTNVSAVLNTISGLSMSGIPPGLQGFSANQICDGDCRCVMGATKRGGMCGQSGGKAYCQCDYATTRKFPSTLRLMLTT